MKTEDFTGTSAEELEIGIDGIKLKRNGQNLDVVDKDGNLTNVRGKSPVADDDLITWQSVKNGDVKEVITNTIVGGVRNIGKSKTTSISYGGDEEIDAALMQIDDGQIKGFSIVLNDPRTAGSCNCYLTINDVQQNGSGEYITIDATNTVKGKIRFSTPIQYNENDAIGAQVVSDSNFKPSTADATVMIRIQDTSP